MLARVASGLLPLALSVTFVPLSFGANVFENGAENTLDTASEDVIVRDGASPTTLNVVDGATISAVPEQDPALPDEGRAIGLFGGSILNLTGGEAAGTLQVNDSATANLSGGLIGEDLEVNGGQINLSGTAAIDDDVFLNATATFNMNDGGEVGDQFFATGMSAVTLGETAGPINDDLFIRDEATLNMAGSELGDELFVQGSGVATITGGYIDDDLNANDSGRIMVSFVEVDDSVDTSGVGFVQFDDGIVNGGFEAVEDSVINIAGGVFENIAGGGEVVLAGGGTINITGGTFGTPGGEDGGSLGSSLGGTLNLTSATIAGVADGNAPEVAVNAVLNGTTTVGNIEFGDLILEAGNSGSIFADGFKASSVTVSTLGQGEVKIAGGEAESVSIAADLNSSVELSGGSFSDISASIIDSSMLTIVGSDITVNGIPLEELDDRLNDSGAFNEETGELGVVAGDIAGTFADGSPFSLSFTRSFGLGNASSVRVIPEPNSLFLVLAGSLASLLGFRQRRLS